MRYPVASLTDVQLMRTASVSPTWEMVMVGASSELVVGGDAPGLSGPARSNPAVRPAGAPGVVLAADAVQMVVAVRNRARAATISQGIGVRAVALVLFPGVSFIVAIANLLMS